MKRRLLFLAIGLAVGGSAHAGGPPLRVCADPNNLPFSDASGQGFENKIAVMIAEKLGRPLEFVWRAQRRGFLRDGLNRGECDLVTGVPTGLFMLRTTRPYYRSTYVFVSRPDEPPVSSLDDPVLRRSKIGVQLIGDDGMNTPPAHALAQRGIIENVRGFPVYGDYRERSPGADIVRAVADRRVDIAAVWGPTAGYFSNEISPHLVVTPFDVAFGSGLAFAFDVSMGVRKGDDKLGDAVQEALDKLSRQIRSTLENYGVPLIERDKNCNSDLQRNVRPHRIRVAAAVEAVLYLGRAPPQRRGYALATPKSAIEAIGELQFGDVLWKMERFISAVEARVYRSPRACRSPTRAPITGRYDRNPGART